ncbi:hypothetical protein ALT717_100117 [Alteromonas macleodii]
MVSRALARSVPFDQAKTWYRFSATTYFLGFIAQSCFLLHLPCYFLIRPWNFACTCKVHVSMVSLKSIIFHIGMDKVNLCETNAEIRFKTNTGFFTT